MNKYKVGIVGLGFIGRKHVQVVEHHEDLELVAVCDIEKSKMQSLSCYQTTDFEDFLQQVLDIVVICTPNYLHSPQTIKALQAGFHVICEKPLAIKSEDALKMMEIAHLHQRKLFCMLQNRYSPIVQWLKNIMNTQKLGEIFWVQVNCFWNRDERYYQKSDWKGKLFKDGGVLYTQFSHFTDILIYLFGHLNAIQNAQFWNFNHQEMIEFEDSGCLNFRLMHDVQVNFNYSISCYEKNLESSITILGEKGTVKVGGQYMNEILACTIKDYELPTIAEVPPANQYGSYQGSASNHQAVYEEFLKVLKGENAQISSILDAYYSVQLIEEIYKRRV